MLRGRYFFKISTSKSATRIVTDILKTEDFDFIEFEMDSLHDDEDGISSSDLFQEPEGYYQNERPPTFTEYTLLSGETLRLRLVGHNPLWVPLFSLDRS